MVSAGAALMREEGSVTGRDLWGDMLALLRDPDRLSGMAAATRARGRPDAADRIAAELIVLARRSAEQGT